MVLLLAGVLAVGVASFFSVLLSARAAVEGFGFVTEAVAGESDFLLHPIPERLPESCLDHLRAELDGLPVEISPVLELEARLDVAGENTSLRVLGLDAVVLIHDPEFPRNGIRELPGRADLVAVSEGASRRFALASGSRLTLHVNDRWSEVTVAGVLEDRPGFSPLPDDLLLMDVPALQQIAGEPGVLSRVEFRIPPGPLRERHWQEVGEKMWDYASAHGFALHRPEERKAAVTRMSAAFRLHLTVLSGLSLLVGVYLIMLAMESAVVRRRREMAILRFLGVTPGQLRMAWLWEGVVLGLAGTVAGLLVGRLLAHGVAGQVTRTIRRVYHDTTAPSMELSPGEMAGCLCLGMVASVIAVWFPARRVSRMSPIRTLRDDARPAFFRIGWMGCLWAVAGWACTRLAPWQSTDGAIPVGGYVAGLCLVIAASIWVGLLFRPLARLLDGGNPGPARRWGASQLRRSRRHHHLTAAGLAVAVGMTLATAWMARSFQHTWTGWMAATQTEDLVITAPGASTSRSPASLSPEVWREVETLPGVERSDRSRRYTVTLGGQEIVLHGRDSSAGGDEAIPFVWWQAPDNTTPDGSSVWISEALSRRFDLAKGSEVNLPTPSGGNRTLVVTGIYAEYGHETGSLTLPRRWTREWFADDRLSQLSLHVGGGHSPEEVRAAIADRFPQVQVTSRRAWNEAWWDSFQQSFTIVRRIEGTALALAVAGLALALAGLMRERRDELVIAKSLGVTRRGIAAAGAWEGTGIALAGCLAGGGLGWALGRVLMDVIQFQSFGWTLESRFPWMNFFLVNGSLLLTAALVSAVTAYRLAALPSDRGE